MPTTPEPVSQPDLNAISNDLAALRRDFAALLTDLRDGPLSSARAAAQQKAGQIEIGRASCRERVSISSPTRLRSAP